MTNETSTATRALSGRVDWTYEDDYMVGTLPELPDLRARLDRDPHPCEPYYDGGTPILRVDRYGRAEQVAEVTSYVTPVHHDDALGYFIGQFGYGHGRGEGCEVWERYMRIFHGADSFVWHEGCGWRDPSYVTFTSTHWREAMGLDETSGVVANMDEWVAYVEGDAYFLTLEERVLSASAYDDDPEDEWEEMHDTTSFGGLYGEVSAQAYAADELWREARARLSGKV